MHELDPGAPGPRRSARCVGVAHGPVAPEHDARGTKGREERARVRAHAVEEGGRRGRGESLVRGGGGLGHFGEEAGEFDGCGGEGGELVDACAPGGEAAVGVGVGAGVIGWWFFGVSDAAVTAEVGLAEMVEHDGERVRGGAGVEGGEHFDGLLELCPAAAVEVDGEIKGLDPLPLEREEVLDEVWVQLRSGGFVLDQVPEALDQIVLAAGEVVDQVDLLEIPVEKWRARWHWRPRYGPE